MFNKFYQTSGSRESKRLRRFVKFISSFLFFTVLFLSAHSFAYATKYDLTPQTVHLGENAGDWFGHALSPAGDFNGDGYEDFVVCANQYAAGSNTGRCYVFLGSNDPINRNASDVSVIKLTAEASSERFGFSVASAGDVNNDGYDDIVIGTYFAAGVKGRAYIFFGSSSPYDKSASDPSVIKITGENIGDRFGFSVASAGDVNNDGFDDIIIGAYSYSSSKGRAYIYLGSSTPTTINASDPSLIKITGVSNNDELGYSVSSAGDYNNDGYDDLITGAKRYNAGSAIGRTYIYFGSNVPNSVTASDPGVITFTGESNLDAFGYSVASARDVNGDGFDDVVVGAEDYNGGNATGRGYIFFGSNAPTSKNASDASVVKITGEVSNEYFAFLVTSIGDINNDGYDDLLFGAEGYSAGVSNGRAYLYLGSSSPTSAFANSLNFIMTGENGGDYFGYTGSFIGDTNGDGWNEFLVGATTYPSWGKRGKVYVYSLNYDLPSNSLNLPSTINMASPITGAIVQSSTNIGGVLYSIDNGNWNTCSPADGSFDNFSENYTCSLSGLIDGIHSIKIKSFDSNNVYIPSSLYVTQSFTVDTKAPTTPDIDSPTGYTKDNTRPSLVYKTVSSVSSYSVSLDSGKNKSYETSGIPSSGTGVWKDDNDVKVEFQADSKVSAYFKGLNSSELSEGKHSWRVTAHDSAGNTSSKTVDFLLDRTSPNSSELAIADVSTVTKDGEYTLAITNRMPSFSGKVEDVSSGSEKTNDNGTRDTFDKVSSGLAMITLTIKKLEKGIYINHLTKDYSITTERFYITTPFPLVDGYYQVTLTPKDKADNNGNSTSFYLRLNYKGSPTTFSKSLKKTPVSIVTEKVGDMLNTVKDKIVQIPKPSVDMLDSVTKQTMSQVQSFFLWVANLFKSLFNK